MAVNLSPIWGAGAQLLDNSGNVLSGGKIYTYAAGTTTPAATYTSSNGVTANSNPIILNSAGRVPYEIWLTDGVNYKFVLKDSNDTLIATYDNLTGINSNYIAFTMQQEIQTATAGQTVFDLTTMQYQPGTNSLAVYVDGVNQYGPGAQYAYVETDSDTVTFVSGLHVGASVKFTTAASVSSNYANADQVTYDPPFTGAVATDVEAKLSEIISVKDFGAVGDGVTDDTTAIQAAIDYCQNKELFFPAGTYVVSYLEIPHSMSFLGCGDNSVIYQKNDADSLLLEVTNGSVILSFNALKFNQNNANQNANNFLFSSEVASVNITFTQCTFVDFVEGALLIKGDRVSTTREMLSVYQCKFRGGTESASGALTYTINASNASEVVVDNCDFELGFVPTTGGVPAITLAASIVTSAEYTKATITNNKFNGYGRFLSGGGIGAVDMYVWGKDVIIDNNIFINNYVIPIRGKVNADKVIITNNIISDFKATASATDGTAIAIQSSTNNPVLGKFIIQGNIIKGALYRGIEVTEGSGNPQSIIINDNIIDTTVNSGIVLIGAKNFCVSGNNISNTTQASINFSLCTGYGQINYNLIDTSAAGGIVSIGNELTLNLQVHGNVLTATTATGITIENVESLSLQDNVVKDVVNGGAFGQRAYRVGGTTGIEVGQVKNNTAIGTYLSGQRQISNAGFTTGLYEYGNTWNGQVAFTFAAPTTGTYDRGSIVWNTAPTSGGNIGWVCVTAGTPGTWKEFGTIA